MVEDVGGDEAEWPWVVLLKKQGGFAVRGSVEV